MPLRLKAYRRSPRVLPRTLVTVRQLPKACQTFLTRDMRGPRIRVLERWHCACRIMHRARRQPVQVAQTNSVSQPARSAESDRYSWQVNRRTRSLAAPRVFAIRRTFWRKSL
jgi:hypothetical protein